MRTTIDKNEYTESMVYEPGLQIFLDDGYIHDRIKLEFCLIFTVSITALLSLNTKTTL